jgi:hypothetical protein
MKIHELISFNRELLEKIHSVGIRPDDYKYSSLYAEYRALTASGEKVTYAVATLSARYGVSERKVYKIIKRMESTVAVVQ